MTPGWITAPGLRKLMPKLFGLSARFGNTPSNPCKAAKALAVFAGGVTAPRMLPFVPKIVALRPHSVKRQAHGKVSKPTKMTSSALPFIFEASKISPPERAGMHATTVSGLMWGSKASKYCPCANDGTARTMASAFAATLGSFVMSSGFDLMTLPVSSVSSYSSSPRAAFHLAASSAKSDTAIVW